MGPFLDENHMGADCISPQNLNDLWKKQIESLAQSGTKVRMIPSTSDLFADPVIPTRAIDEKEFAYCREYMVSNPCFLGANKWTISAISADLPLNLMKTEIVKNPTNSCKFTRVRSSDCITFGTLKRQIIIDNTLQLDFYNGICLTLFIVINRNCAKSEHNSILLEQIVVGKHEVDPVIVIEARFTWNFI